MLSLGMASLYFSGNDGNLCVLYRKSVQYRHAFTNFNNYENNKIKHDLTNDVTTVCVKQPVQHVRVQD